MKRRRNVDLHRSIADEEQQARVVEVTHLGQRESQSGTIARSTTPHPTLQHTLFVNQMFGTPKDIWGGKEREGVTGRDDTANDRHNHTNTNLQTSGQTLGFVALEWRATYA